MKVIVKLYMDSGAREDWQTLGDYVLVVPDDTRLYDLSSRLNKDLAARLKAEGVEPYGDMYFEVDPVKEVDDVSELLELVGSIAQERQL